MTIADDYFRNCNIASDINEHLGYMVDLCQELNAKRVIELGVRSGVSTTAWLYGLSLTDGSLWSVDIDGRPQIAAKDWIFLQGDDRDPKVLALLPQSVDIVFIDTSHRFDHTMAELSLYSVLVGSGGRIVLHDTEVESPDGTDEHDFPVKRAVELFCESNGWQWSNRPNNNGLATVEVP